MNDETDLEPTIEPTNEPEADAAPKRRKTTKTESDLVSYRVVKAAIAPNGGARDALIRPGETVQLTKEQAKHYNALGFLAPIIED
jgi:hypothetical protein